MKTSIKIHRFNIDLKEKFYTQDYKIEIKNRQNLLETLDQIKENTDASLTYRSGCRSGVCGSCSLIVNGVETLACKHKVKANDEISPLNNFSLIKDLVINLKNQKIVLKRSKAFLQEYKKDLILKKDEEKIDTLSKCILCQNCYSACPVYTVNSDFLGPFALSRVLRYVNDKKENNTSLKLESIQENGIWDCTLCGNCTMVCPQLIDSKNDILKLRIKAVQAGYKDPNVQDFSSFQNDFDSGFNPNF